MTRRWPHTERPTSRIDFRVGERIADDDVDDLDHFLTARWALLTTRFGRLRYGTVSHPKWPLHHVRDLDVRPDVIEAAGLPAPTGDPVARYSPGVPVDLGWFDAVRSPAAS